MPIPGLPVVNPDKNRIYIGAVRAPSVQHVVECPDVEMTVTTRPSSTPALADDYRYELHPSYALPVINCKRYVKDVVFSPTQLKRVNYWLHRGRYLLAISFFIGAISSFALYMAPAPVGRWVSVSLLLSEGPAVFATFISLRYDILVLLTGMFEIWYTSFLNLTSMAMLALHFQDQRGIGMIMCVLGFQLISVIDANNRLVKNTIVTSFLGSLLYLSCGFYVVTDLIDQARVSLVLFSYGPHQLLAEDIITNGLATGIIIFVRNAYRKHIATDHKTQRHRPFVVPCITYRCHLELRRVGQSTTAILPTATQDSQSRLASGSTPDDGTIQLRFVPIPTVFDARATYFHLVFKARSPHKIALGVRRCLFITALMGMLLAYGSPLAAILGLSTGQDSSVVLTILSLGFVASMIFALTVSSLYQRGLLKRLLTNFDFLFLSGQMTLAMLAACDMFHWDERCLVLATSWLCVHVVLTLDALPPVWRVHLGVSKKFVVAVIMLSIVQCVSFAFDILVWEGKHFRDREMFTVHLASHTKSVQVVPFLFSRLTSMFLWSVRLLWRYWKYWPKGLVLLQGQVEYTDTHMLARHRSKMRNFGRRLEASVSSRAVVPLATQSK